MKKRIIIVISVVVVILFSVIYLIGSWNIPIIKPLPYFKTAFEEQGSTWYCSKFNLEAVVPDIEDAHYINITDLNTGKKYILDALDYLTVELYGPGVDESALYSGNFELLDQKSLYRTKIVFKKRWGKVYKFIIEYVDKDCWYEEGNYKLEFKLRNKS